MSKRKTMNSIKELKKKRKKEKINFNKKKDQIRKKNSRILCQYQRW